MTQQNINFGTTAANDGEDLFSAFTKIEANFVELYGSAGTVSHAITDVASAATCDIGAAATDRIRITGSVTITSFGTSANKLRFVHFDAALTLTYNATTLILPDAVNKPVEAGDAAIFSSDASGNWRCLNYYSADDDVDSSDVTFLQSGTGAVERTALAKMRDVVHVLDYIPVAEHAAILAKTTTTNLATYIQAAIDYVDGLGGGYVEFGYGLYVSGPLVLKDRVVLRGKGPQATEIKLANSSNASFIVSESFSTLQATTNQWTVAQGMPVWLGLWGMRVNGNKANQNAGNAVNLYAKALILGDLIVYDAYAVGIFSEGGDIAGQADWYDLPEGGCGPIWIRNCGSHGWHMRGPHDIRLPQLVINQSGGDGLRIERSVGVYSGSPDIGFAHIYANTGKGIRANTSFRGELLISESNAEEGVYLDGTAGQIQVSQFQLYLNCTTSGSFQFIDNASAFNTVISQILIKSPGRAGVGYAQVLGDLTTISDLQIYGDGASDTGIGLSLGSGANFCRINGHIRLISGAGGIGFKDNDGGGHQYANISLTIQDCTNLWYHNSGGSQNHYEIIGFAPAGDVALHASSATPFATGFDTGFFKGIENAATQFSYGSYGYSDGTAALPSFFFGSDRDTGIFLSATGKLAVTAGGVRRAGFSSAGLLLPDTNASHDLAIAAGSNLTADRTTTLVTGDADRTITVSGNATISQDYSSTGSPTFASPVVTTIELGHASDTTLARSGAGDVTIEGNAVYRAGGTDVPIADGGTGASTARAACAGLGTWHVLGASAAALSRNSVNGAGDTTEETLATITIPAGAMGANGRARVTTLWTYTNSANSKTLRGRFNGLGGTAYLSNAVTTTAQLRHQFEVANRNATNSQVGGNASLGGGGWSTTTAAVATSAVDTTGAVNIVLTTAWAGATSGETITLESYVVELYSLA